MTHTGSVESKLRYQAVLRHQANDDEPAFTYSEVDSARRESRRVEMFGNRTFGMAGAGISTQSTRLSESPLPSIEETSASEGTSARPIDKKKFEEVWQQAAAAETDGEDIREVFLRGVWNAVIPSSDPEWVERVAALEGDTEPLGDYGPLLKKMLDHGLSPAEVARFAQIIGYGVAFGMLSHIDDNVASYEGLPDARDEYFWQLYAVDPETLEPISTLTSLNESLLTEDPSGREMRPPSES